MFIAVIQLILVLAPCSSFPLVPSGEVAGLRRRLLYRSDIK